MVTSFENVDASRRDAPFNRRLKRIDATQVCREDDNLLAGMNGPKVPEGAEQFDRLAFVSGGNQRQQLADPLPFGRERDGDKHRRRFLIGRRRYFPLPMFGFKFLPQLTEQLDSGVGQKAIYLGPSDHILCDAVHVMEQCTSVGHRSLAPVDVKSLVTVDGLVNGQAQEPAPNTTLSVKQGPALARS